MNLGAWVVILGGRLRCNELGTLFVGEGDPQTYTMIIQHLIEYLNGIHPLSDDLQAYLAENVQVYKFKKKEFILREGQVAKYIYIIWKGMIRFYYTMPDGEEVSSRFMSERDPAAPILSFFSQVPSHESMVAHEDCEVFGISYDALEKGRKQFLEFNYVAFELIKLNYFTAEERLLIIRRRTARERFELLMQKFPLLVQRVSKKLLASYIDLAPSQMSRKDF